VQTSFSRRCDELLSSRSELFKVDRVNHALFKRVISRFISRFCRRFSVSLLSSSLLGGCMYEVNGGVSAADS